MQKLYCYVDETGQDTKGDFFLVSVVITQEEREQIRKQLEKTERKTGKGRRKWIESKPKQRQNYVRKALKIPTLRGGINYAIYHKTTDYIPRTILTTARAITRHAEKEYKATVFVDGLPKTLTRWFGAELRHLHISTKKVRGVRREEADTLMRLADAIAGFVREAVSGNKDMAHLLKKAKRKGIIVEL